MNPYETRDSQRKAFHLAEKSARAVLAAEENPAVTYNYDGDGLLDVFPGVTFVPADFVRTAGSTWDSARRAVVLGQNRCLVEIVHALSHRDTPEEYARHGPEFIQTLLGNLESFGGGHVAAVYEEALRAQKQLRFTPSHKPAVAALNFISSGLKGKPFQVVLVWEAKTGKATKAVGEFMGFTTQRKTGERVARLRSFGQVTERDVPVKQLRYAFRPRQER